MAINTLEYAKIFMQKLDQQVVREATTGWMEENAGQVKYNGGDEVKIANLSTVGLAQYDRDEGFAQGSVTLKYDTYKMTQDRGRTFQLDRMDVDETNFLATTANVLKEFQGRHVVPEIDSYRYSKLAAKAEEAGKIEKLAITADNIVSKLREHLQAVEDVIGDEQLIITLPSTIAGMIMDSPAFGRSVGLAEFKQGGLHFKVRTIDDHVLRVVPSARLKTLYDISDGRTNAADKGGLTPNVAAKDINWLITPRRLPIAISKTEKLRIFSPDQNQKADAWKIDYRKYHDLWVLEQQKEQLFVCTTA